jgi:hypothetical protein
MGKASSSKKVARAAGTGGGRTNRGRTPWMYYGAIVLVAVLGTAAVVTSRDHRLSTINAAGQTTPPLVNTDHWHVAYGIDLCGKMQAPITSTDNPDGIHTKGDGVIYVEPTADKVAGKNATLGKFASAVHMTLNAGELKVPGGHDYHDSDDCEGKPGQVQVQVFTSPSDTTGSLAKVDPQDIPFTDQSMLTIAFLPKGAKIPAPPAAAVTALKTLVAAAAAATTTTTTPGAAATPTTTTAGGAATTAPATSSGTTTATTASTATTGTTATATTVPGTTATTAKK